MSRIHHESVLVTSNSYVSSQHVGVSVDNPRLRRIADVAASVTADALGLQESGELPLSGDTAIIAPYTAVCPMNAGASDFALDRLGAEYDEAVYGALTIGTSALTAIHGVDTYTARKAQDDESPLIRHDVRTTTPGSAFVRLGVSHAAARACAELLGQDDQYITNLRAEWRVPVSGIRDQLIMTASLTGIRPYDALQSPRNYIEATVATSAWHHADGLMVWGTHFEEGNSEKAVANPTALAAGFGRAFEYLSGVYNEAGLPE